jgi:hypothetical protein
MGLTDNRKHAMKRTTSRPSTFAAALSAGLVILASGCATTRSQVVTNPQPDHHALQIMKLVKEEPSQIHGGGMIYELFVGGRFNARLNDHSGDLTITDLENDSDCTFHADGVLEADDPASPEYATYCAHLSTNTYELLDE